MHRSQLYLLSLIALITNQISSVPVPVIAAFTRQLMPLSTAKPAATVPADHAATASQLTGVAANPAGSPAATAADSLTPANQAQQLAQIDAEMAAIAAQLQALPPKVPVPGYMLSSPNLAYDFAALNRSDIDFLRCYEQTKDVAQHAKTCRDFHQQATFKAIFQPGLRTQQLLQRQIVLCQIRAKLVGSRLPGVLGQWRIAHKCQGCDGDQYLEAAYTAARLAGSAKLEQADQTVTTYQHCLASRAQLANPANLPAELWACRAELQGNLRRYASLKG